MLFREDISQILISKIPCTKVLQYTLAKYAKVSHSTKTKMKEVTQSLQPPVFDQCEEGGFPTGLSVHLPVPFSVTGLSNKL